MNSPHLVYLIKGCCLAVFLALSASAIRAEAVPTDSVYFDLTLAKAAHEYPSFPLPHFFSVNALKSGGANPSLSEVFRTDHSISSFVSGFQELVPQALVHYDTQAGWIVVLDEVSEQFLDLELPQVPPIVRTMVARGISRRFEEFNIAQQHWFLSVSHFALIPNEVKSATIDDSGRAVSVHEYLSQITVAYPDAGFFLWWVEKEAALECPECLATLGIPTPSAEFFSGDYQLYAHLSFVRRAYFTDFENPAAIPFYRALPLLKDEEEQTRFLGDQYGVVRDLVLADTESERLRGERILKAIPGLWTIDYRTVPTEQTARALAVGYVRVNGTFTLQDPEVALVESLLMEPSGLEPDVALRIAAACARGRRTDLSARLCHWTMEHQEELTPSAMDLLYSTLSFTARVANRPDLEAIFLEAFRGGEAYRSNPVQWDALLTAAEELEASFQVAD